jgi:hypothetical protein
MTYKFLVLTPASLTPESLILAFGDIKFWSLLGEPGSSVSIVSGYGLDDQAIGVRSPAEAKDFSSNLCVQTGSGAHPVGTGHPFPRAKAPIYCRGREWVGAIPPLHPRALLACSGTALASDHFSVCKMVFEGSSHISSAPSCPVFYTAWHYYRLRMREVLTEHMV